MRGAKRAAPALERSVRDRFSDAPWGGDGPREREKAASHGGNGMPPCATHDRGVIGCHNARTERSAGDEHTQLPFTCQTNPGARGTGISVVSRSDGIHRLSAVVIRSTPGIDFTRVVRRPGHRRDPPQGSAQRMSSQIDHLLNETRRFAPPEEFAAGAVATAELYERAAERPRGVLGRAVPRAAALAHSVQPRPSTGRTLPSRSGSTTAS